MTKKEMEWSLREKKQIVLDHRSNPAQTIMDNVCTIRGLLASSARTPDVLVKLQQVVIPDSIIPDPYDPQ